VLDALYVDSCKRNTPATARAHVSVHENHDILKEDESLSPSDELDLLSDQQSAFILRSVSEFSVIVT